MLHHSSDISKPNGTAAPHELALRAGKECEDEALRLLALGWPVLALCPPDHVGVGKKHGRTCKHPGKAPIVEWKRYQEELPTEEEVRGWWKWNPQANLGVALGGPNRLLRLDIDGPLGEEELARLAGGDLPATLEFTSGRDNGGRGLLFLIPEGQTWRTQIEGSSVGQELRIQALGAQTVLPPSRHRYGTRYAWLPDRGPGMIDAALAPRWLVALMTNANGHTGKRKAPPLPDGEPIPRGARNSTLTSLAGTMRRRGMSADAIFAALVVENERCEPPLDEEEVRKIAESVGRYSPHPAASASVGEPIQFRPEILITTEEHEVNAQAAAVLGNDPSLYQRTGLLVRIVRDTGPAARGIQRPFVPRIEALPPALLRERLAACARWQKVRKTDEGEFAPVPAHPPAWCVAAVLVRADWPGVRYLDAVVDYPVLRPDGTVLAAPGYDPGTGLLMEMAGERPDMPDAPTYAQAVAARDQLLAVVSDFPFERPTHKAAWLAALLTPLARFAFSGPAPLFLVDANVRGAGKGLLLDCIAHILTGERFTVATYTSDEDELRKRITSLALSGDRLVLFDNIEGRFGNGTLDAALTGVSWEDRILGGNRMLKCPLFMTWYATGNNVAVGADTARRVCHIRLESPEERPELRQDFARPDLLGYVAGQRQQLLAAALTILRAYCVTGRPDQNLTAWGSFNGWSRLVRSAVVWAGLPDPAQTRMQLQDQADVTAVSMELLLSAWERMDPAREGVTGAEMIERLKSPDKPPALWHADLRDAVEGLVGKLDARALGTKLRSSRRRIFGGRYIDKAGAEHRANRWAVYPAEQFRRGAGDTRHTPHTHRQEDLAGAGECGECGECVSPQAEERGDAWEGDG